MGQGAGPDPVHEEHKVPQGDRHDSILVFLGMKPRIGLQNINLDKEVTENIWYEEESVMILEMEDIGHRGNILDV